MAAGPCAGMGMRGAADRLHWPWGYTGGGPGRRSGE